MPELDMAPDRIYTLTDDARTLFQMFMPEPLPADATHIAVSKDGFLPLTEQDWKQIRSNSHSSFVFPSFTMLSYYPVSYE